MNTDFLVNVSTLPVPFVGRFQTNGTKLNDEQFEMFCRQNPELRIEQSKEGELIVMPGTGGLTGNRNFLLTGRFGIWVEKDATGVGFDSSTIFTLPNGAKLSPDVSWVRKERWNALSKEEQQRFAPICPDFVIELRSRTDSLKTLQAKMLEYIENGAELGWLIDPTKRKIYVYHPNEAVEILNEPQEISGAPILPGFTLELKDFWD